MSYSSPLATNIIIDNSRPDKFSYQGLWSTYNASQWFNDTVSTPNATSSSVTLTFNGTSAALIGTTPPSSASQSFMVSIDNKTAVNTSFSDPNPSSYRQWYQSPTLSEGLHTIRLSNLTGPSIDFALVTLGPQTPIMGERIVVDDADSGITFGAGWRTDRDKFNVGGLVPMNGFTLGNSTHDTATVGSSFTYRFSGTALAIFGLFDFSSPSLLILSFSIDSQALSQTYRVTSSSPELVAELGQEPNYPFYSFDFLLSGEHTLVVNVTACINTTFRFDYLTYVPTFGRLSDMPDLGGSGGSGSSSSGSGGGGRSRVGMTVGAAAGAIVGSILLGVLLFLFLRRRARRRNGLWTNKSTAVLPSSPAASPNSPLLSSPTNMNTNSWTTASAQNPNTGSTLGPMARMQDASAVQYGLSFPHAYDSHPVSNAASPPPVNVDPPSYDEVTSAPAHM